MDFPPRTHPPFHHLKWGVFFILLAWASFTLMATLSHFAKDAAISLPVVLFFQNFVSWVLVLPWVFVHGFSALKTKKFGLIFARSFMGLSSFAFLFLAVQRISLVNAILLNNTAPLLVPFVVLAWLKNPINHKLWLGVIAGFLGVIFILKPGKEIFDLGALYGLGAGLSLSFIMVAVRRLSYTERSHTVLFYYFLIASILCLPLAIYSWKALNGIDWLILLGIGFLFFLGQWCFMRAFHHAKPSILGPFCYIAVVYSGLIEWILWGKHPDFYSWIGIALVCSGGIWTIRHSS